MIAPDALAGEIAAAIEEQAGEFGGPVDLSEKGDLTSFMVFDAVDLIDLAERLLAKFEIAPGSSDAEQCSV